MRVLFCIRSGPSGGGGHVHSLTHIVNELRMQIECSIISIGATLSPTLSGNLSFRRHIKFNGVNFFSMMYELRREVDRINPDLIHCFDANSYNILKLIFRSKKYKFVLSKCGGPNPRGFPLAPNIILFSIENFEWFKSQRKFQDTCIFLIPNRVFPLEANDRKGDIGKSDRFTFMRIARIGKAYRKSILDSINLAKELSIRGHSVLLYIVGFIEDKNIYESVKKAASGIDVIFLTTEQYTNQASKMLYLADAVIGTGRGLMEASSLGIPVLTPVADLDIPVLIDEENFRHFFSTNFSGRSLTNADQDYYLKSIEKILTSKEHYLKSSSFSTEVFFKYFSIKQVSQQYIQVYQKVLADSHHIPWYYDLKSKISTIKKAYVKRR